MGRELMARELIERDGQRIYLSLAYSDLATMRMGTSGSASFQRAKKSW